MSVRTVAPWALVLVASTIACDPTSPPPAPTTSTATAAEPPREAPARGETRQRTVYVPAYSHLNKTKDKRNLYAITLSVRNIDPTSEITLSHVDYYDTSGHRVRRYVASPMKLAPLETAEFFVEMSDDVGGSGAAREPQPVAGRSPATSKRMVWSSSSRGTLKCAVALVCLPSVGGSATTGASRNEKSVSP